jgi:hypothetical protein
MASSCIGYYTTLTTHPQEIQGLWFHVLNDPLYIKDIQQMIIPIGNNEIFKKNKEYIPSPDLLSADENSLVLVGKDLKKIGNGCSKNDTFYGKGIHTSGGGLFKRLSKIVEHDIAEDHARRDIRNSSSQIKKHIKEAKLKKKKKHFIRPLAKDVFKMENKKKVIPGMKLKKKLLSHKGMKYPNTFRKKQTKINNLMERFR